MYRLNALIVLLPLYASLYDVITMALFDSDLFVTDFILDLTLLKGIKAHIRINIAIKANCQELYMSTKIKERDENILDTISLILPNKPLQARSASLLNLFRESPEVLESK